MLHFLGPFFEMRLQSTQEYFIENHLIPFYMFALYNGPTLNNRETNKPSKK